MLDILESAQRLIKAATGEPYGDYETVMNVGKGTQWDDEKIWVIGNWNGTLGGRLFKALERIGVDCEWYDEHEECSDCHKLLRTRSDSYFWQPQYLRTEECEYVCLDCLDLSDDSVLDDFKFIDNADKCVPDKLGEKLTSWGWEPYNGTYENGWHPGQTDDPHKILARIEKDLPGYSVVFRLDEVSQFYIRFTAWTKDRRDEDKTKYVMTESGRILLRQDWEREQQFNKDWKRLQEMEKLNREWREAQEND